MGVRGGIFVKISLLATCFVRTETPYFETVKTKTCQIHMRLSYYDHQSNPAPEGRRAGLRRPSPTRKMKATYFRIVMNGLPPARGGGPPRLGMRILHRISFTRSGPIPHSVGCLHAEGSRIPLLVNIPSAREAPPRADRQHRANDFESPGGPGLSKAGAAPATLFFRR